VSHSGNSLNSGTSPSLPGISEVEVTSHPDKGVIFPYHKRCVAKESRTFDSLNAVTASP